MRDMRLVIRGSARFDQRVVGDQGWRMRLFGEAAERHNDGSTRRRIHLVAGLMAVAAVVLMLAACAPVDPAPGSQCPQMATWPSSLPLPPAGVVVAHPVGTIVRVVNGTDAPIKVRFRTVTPGDCGATPPLLLDNGTVLEPGKSAEWSGDVPHPRRGPVLGGVEIWTRACDEACSDPPDAFASVEITGGR